MIYFSMEPRLKWNKIILKNFRPEPLPMVTIVISVVCQNRSVNSSHVTSWLCDELIVWRVDWQPAQRVLTSQQNGWNQLLHPIQVMSQTFFPANLLA